MSREKYNSDSDLKFHYWPSDIDDCSHSIEFITLYYVKFINKPSFAISEGE